MWASFNQLKALERLRFPEEGILPQGCDMETLPEFPTCWLVLQNSDSRLHLNFQPANLPYRFQTCQLQKLNEPIFKINLDNLSTKQK